MAPVNPAQWVTAPFGVAQCHWLDLVMHFLSFFFWKSLSGECVLELLWLVVPVYHLPFKMLVCLKDLLGRAGSPASPFKCFRKVPALWQGLVPEWPGVGPGWPAVLTGDLGGTSPFPPCPLSPGTEYLVPVLEWACWCSSPVTLPVSRLLVVSGIWGPSSGLHPASFILERHIQFWSVQVSLPCLRTSLCGW